MSRIPQIERKPRTASETTTHYGYCAFKEIDLGGPSGLEHNVQPAESPYYRKLPAKRLIPFTNVEFKVIDEMQTGMNARTGTPSVVWKTFNKFAKECVYEMADSYANWGFQVVEPLTGFTDVEEVEAIFDAIQPFDYKLKDLVVELGVNAQERINATEAYEVSYEGETRALLPLDPSLREVAEQVRVVLYASATKAHEEANKTKQKTFISMTKAFAGGDGKTVPDPHDNYIYDELGDKPPSIFNQEKQDNSTDAIKVLAEALAGKDSEASERIKAKEAELDEKLAKLDAFLVSQENKDKMAAVRAAKPNKQAA